MTFSFKKTLHLLRDYKITLIVALLCIVIYLLLAQGWLHRDQLFYFQQLSAWHKAPWRFLSPIFLHHTPLHLLTNLVVWGEFARQIEKQQGSWILLCLVIVMGIASNSLEFLMVDHRFGGLSGVVIGLGAYIGLLSLKPNQQAWDFPVVYWLALVGLFIFDMGGHDRQAAHYVHGTGLVLGVMCGAMMWFKWQKADNLN